MIIAVEGIDNSGKSTLALKLAHDLKATYVKTWYKPAHGVDLASYCRALEFLENLGAPVVVDRHMAISERVYGPVLRDRVVFHQAIAAQACESLHVIYCRAPIDHMAGTLWERHQMLGVAAKFKELLGAYDELIRNSHFKFSPIFYDWTCKGIYEVVLGQLKRRMQ